MKSRLKAGLVRGASALIDNDREMLVQVNVIESPS
jgi:hypothetical protein